MKKYKNIKRNRITTMNKNIRIYLQIEEENCRSKKIINYYKHKYKK